MDKKKKGLILSILGIISLVLVTSGVTYAFFSYTKEGATDNTITSESITFLYTEVSGVGRGISIDDALPTSDDAGKRLTGEGKVFDFKITSNITETISIPYEVTARMKEGSDLDPEAVRIYLTKVNGMKEEEVLLDNYDNLTQTTKVDEDLYIEKTIYTGKVPSNQKPYEQDFRLRMWIDEKIDYSPVKDENGNDTYPYNDKEFTITVNVYAEGKVVTAEDIEMEENTDIGSLSVADEILIPATGQDYNYETTLPEGTTSTTIEIETENKNATVEVEKVDSLAYSNSNIKRLATKKILELEDGNNYFKITVTSENGSTKKEYKIKVYVIAYMDSNTLLTIGDAITAKDGTKWHVLETSVSGIETVTLLSDYNLNSDGTYNTECSGKQSDRENENHAAFSCSPMAFDTDGTNIYNIEDSNNIGYFIKKTYEPLVTSSLVGTTNVTLPTAAQIATANGQIFDQNDLSITEFWLLTTNYWTKTANTSLAGRVWRISSSLGHGYAYNLHGARPVITTLKTNLLIE